MLFIFILKLYKSIPLLLHILINIPGKTTYDRFYRMHIEDLFRLC
jgi:hypothetical protein